LSRESGGAQSLRAERAPCAARGKCVRAGYGGAARPGKSGRALERCAGGKILGGWGGGGWEE
jgi:hypothetical protein